MQAIKIAPENDRKISVDGPVVQFGAVFFLKQLKPIVPPDRVLGAKLEIRMDQRPDDLDYGNRLRRILRFQCIEAGRSRFVEKRGPGIDDGVVQFLFLRKIIRDQIDVDARLSGNLAQRRRSEENTSELQSLMRNSYAVFCLKKKK